MQLSIPKEYHGKVVALLTEIEQLQIETDMPAKIIGGWPASTLKKLFAAAIVSC